MSTTQEPPPLLSLPCVRCGTPFCSHTIKAALCPPCEAAGAHDDIGEV